MAAALAPPSKPRGVISPLSPENFGGTTSSSQNNNNSPPGAGGEVVVRSTSPDDHHPFRQQHSNTPPLLQTPFQQKRFAQQAGHLPYDGDGEIEGDCTSPFSSKLYGNDESTIEEFNHSSNNNTPKSNTRRNHSFRGGTVNAADRRASRRATVVVSPTNTPTTRKQQQQQGGGGIPPNTPNNKDLPPPSPSSSPRRASISTKDTMMRRFSTFQSRSTTAVNTTSSASGKSGYNKLVLSPCTPGGGGGGSGMLAGASSFATPSRHPRMGSVINSNGTSASTYLGIQGSAGLAVCSPRIPAPPRRPTDTQLQHIKSVSANRGCFRTFDRETGALTHHSLDSFPSVISLTRTQYNEHISDPQMQEQARRHVGTLSLEKQVRLAVGSIRRHHANNCARRKHADVFDKESNEGRMAAMLNIEVDDLIAHLGKETERLSRMRIERAAADEHLMNLARLEAKRKVAVLEEKLLPDALPMVDLLRLQLDACRRMPEPPRQMLPPDAPKLKKTSIQSATSSSNHNHGNGNSSKLASNVGHIKRTIGAVVRIAGGGGGGSGGATGSNGTTTTANATSAAVCSGSTYQAGITTTTSTVASHPNHGRRSVIPTTIPASTSGIGTGKSVTIDVPLSDQSAF